MLSKFTRYPKNGIRLGCLYAVLIALVACGSDAVLPIEQEETTSSMQVRLSVQEGRNVGSAINSLVVSGSSVEGTFTNQTGVGGVQYGGEGAFDVASYAGKKSFFFAANLTPADRSRVKAATHDAFNTLTLTTADYIPTPSITAPIPMVAMLVGKTFTEIAATFKLTRLFALVDYTITLPTGYQLVEVMVENIPAKFSLASAIDNYDQTDLGYISYNLGTQKTGKFFLPENKVADPVFYDADHNGMTYMRVRYKESASADQVYTTGFRIAEHAPNAGYAHYGHLKRNAIYTFTIPISATTKNNKTPFLN